MNRKCKRHSAVMVWCTFSWRGLVNRTTLHPCPLHLKQEHLLSVSPWKLYLFPGASNFYRIRKGIRNRLSNETALANSSWLVASMQRMEGVGTGFQHLPLCSYQTGTLWMYSKGRKITSTGGIHSEYGYWWIQACRMLFTPQNCCRTHQQHWGFRFFPLSE